MNTDLNIWALVLSSSAIGAIVAAVITKYLDFWLKKRELKLRLAEKLLNKKIDDFDGIINVINKGKRYKVFNYTAIDTLGISQKRASIFANYSVFKSYFLTLESELDQFLFKSDKMSFKLFQFYDSLRLILSYIEKEEFQLHTGLIGVLIEVDYTSKLESTYDQLNDEFQAIYSKPIESLESSKKNHFHHRGEFEISYRKKLNSIFDMAKEIIRSSHYESFQNSFYHFDSHLAPTMSRESRYRGEQSASNGYLIPPEVRFSDNTEDGRIKPPGGLPDNTIKPV